MYIPAHFRLDDRDQLEQFIQAHSFALLVSTLNGAPFASHLPVYLEPEKGPLGAIRGHLARANPQCETLVDNGQEVLLVFQGPHAYISPSWYPARRQQSVPTWNYTAVHVYGKVRQSDTQDALIETMSRLSRIYEAGKPSAWDPSEMEPGLLDKMASAVIGFEIEITRIEGKFKLSQNRSAEDISNVAVELEQLGDEMSIALAAMMRLNTV
jgi:transcriptional regulator